MNVNTDEMLQSYGLDTPFPQQWTDSKYSSALATLGNEPTSANDDSRALVDELLSALTTTHSVATDEQDPLGSGHSIMEILHHAAKGVPESAADRGIYMPSSTSFDPRKFLREVHGSASIAELEQGLAYLKQSMAGNENGLRKMVDSDYESYVTSKRRLDEVMTQLNHIGVKKSSKYGMEQLEQRLAEATNQLTVRARPLDGVSAERQRLENALRSLESHRELLELPQSLEKHRQSGEHDQFLRDYKRGVRLLRPMTDDSASPEEQKLGMLIADRAQAILHKYRDQIHKQLMKTPADGAYTPLLAKLTDLGVSGNPALEWLENNIKRFVTEIDETFNLLKTNATRNLVDSLESGRKLDLTTYLRNITPVKASASPTIIDEVAEMLDSNSVVVDSEGAIQQWKQLVASFEGLKLILNRATVFYHEFICISQSSSSTSGNLRLSQAEITSVTRHCQDLVSMTGQRLVECLTTTMPKELTLPIAAAHSREAGAHYITDASDLLSFLPLNTNSIAVAKYLGRILEILSLMLSQISELLPMNSINPLADSVSVVKQQFVKALCECWTRDSMQLGKIQIWSVGSAPRFPDYFSTYHGLIIEKLRYLLDSGRGGPASPELVSHIDKVFPAALALSIRSVEAALIESTRSSINDAQQAMIEAQLQPASLGQDAKLLVTLSNLEELRITSLEHVYDQYETVFKHQHHTKLVRQEVTPEVEKISSQLFDIFIRKKRSRLSQIVHQEMHRLLPHWRNDDNSLKTKERSVRCVSNYVYECLMVLVETHSLCVESCPQFTRHALLELYANLLNNYLSILRDVDNLSRYGTLQAITDLEFMRWAMNQFPETTSTCQNIFESIRKASTDEDIWSHPDGPRGLVISVLDVAVRRSHFAFLCFKSLSQK